MSDICRLCLSFCTQNMTPLRECETLVNKVLSLSILNPPNSLFPRQICANCMRQLTELYDFCIQVQKNNEILVNHLNNGLESLITFYKGLRDGIKKESDASNIENAREVVDKVVNEYEEDFKQVKIEDDPNIEHSTDYNSEDDLPLLEMKEETVKEFKAPQSSSKVAVIEFKFKCLTCFENFNKRQSLVKHYNNVHRSKTKNETSFDLVAEDGTVLYKCEKCDKTFDVKRKMMKHSQVHTDNRFHCRMCSRTYKTVSEIVRHGRAHDGAKLSCSFGCGFSTVYSGSLKNHENGHRRDFKYKCETCNKDFQVKTWYEQHQNVHKGIKPFVCGLCGLAFHMDRYLTAHRSSVHPEASSLDRYVCVQCSKPCGSMKALTVHLKEHGITSSLLCDLCGKTLASTEQLKAHRRMHLGIKPFLCTTCNKSFSKKNNLKLHLVTHTGARAHACASCGKQYTQRSALLRHVARHHSGSAKNCMKCEKAFSTQAQLESHQKLCS